MGWRGGWNQQKKADWARLETEVDKFRVFSAKESLMMERSVLSWDSK